MECPHAVNSPARSAPGPPRLARGHQSGSLAGRALVPAAGVLLLAGCGGGSSGLTAARPALAKTLMTARLNAKHLDYRWVACIRVGRTYRHVAITRCNVNFGIDPH